VIGAHYSGSYLFFNYTALRFSPEFTRVVIHAPKEGINAVQVALNQLAKGMKVEDLFADWAVTNYLNDPSVENGKYAYSNETNFRISREPVLNQVPVVRSETMSEYATSYFGIQPASGGVNIVFTGTTTTKLIPVDAHAGKWMWYSNRADLADMTLTRDVDLSNVKQATLKFWTWYDIEQGFDYAYAEASTDGGKTWDVLPGKNTTTDNPNGSSYGSAFTGHSGSPDSKNAAQWVEEQVNLSAYAGKKILLRLEYITDDAFNAPGFAVDDISIPEINFVDGVENGENGWQAQGFVRIDNVLPQQFLVQVVTKGAATQVQRVSLDAMNRGVITIDGFGKDVTRAELIVNAFAPTTTEPTKFEFAVLPK
jgi:immune inhibitor A